MVRPPPPLHDSMRGRLAARLRAGRMIAFADSFALPPLLSAAEADPRDQGLPADGAAEGRAVGADQAGQGRRQVQGSLLQVPLHPLRPRRRQGHQAQAVAPARFVLRCSVHEPFIHRLLDLSFVLPACQSIVSSRWFGMSHNGWRV